MLEALQDLFVTLSRKFREGRTFMVVMRPFLIALITANSIFTRERMSHENGLVARGKVRLSDSLDLPENDFFKPGKEFDCCLRHASVSFLDDAALVVRAGSLKFSSGPVDSPFDMLMNNGIATPFWNMDTFWQFMRARSKGGRAHLIPYFKRNPRCYFNVRDALRKNPESFAFLEYYSQTPLQFIAADGKTRYAKFRLLPNAPISPPDGEPTEEELQTPWFQGAQSTETRTRNYLKEEYRQRLSKENIEYRFEIQLLEWDPVYDRGIELNSLYSWNEDRHPWRPLATVTMVKALDHEDGNRFIYSLHHLPSTLRVIPALGIVDGPSIDYLRLGGKWPRKARLWMYKIFGQKKPIPNLRQTTAVQNRDRTTTVIVSDDIYMRPSLPQNDDDKRKFLRKRQINRALGLYQYIHGFIQSTASHKTELWKPRFWDQRVFHIFGSDHVKRETVPLPLPPFIRELSEQEKYSDYVQGRLYKVLGASIVSKILSFCEDRLLQYKGLNVYRYMYFGNRRKPNCINYWQDDAYFAQQRLSGVNPMSIEAFKSIPDHFPVTDELLEGLMDSGETLASAIAGNRLYACDYSLLEGISCREGCYPTQPIALFYTGQSAPLMPVAIQLFQDPNEGPIFTPKDDPGVWQAAKTYTQSADAQVHEVVEHLLHGHLIVEVFDIAIHRTLPNAHPVNKMLMPHLEFTMAVNNSARTQMLAPGGPIDRSMAVGAKGAFELMARAWWENWDFSRNNIKLDIERRGIGDIDALRDFYWRDDALKIWDIVENYVKSMIEHFYACDQSVRDDWEIQAFHKEVRDEMGGDVRGMPGGADGFKDRQTLVEVLTRLIYTASAGHAAVNNGQYDSYGFIPNVPGAMYRSPPRKKTDIWSDEDFIKAMPKFKTASIQIIMVEVLSRRTELPLGTFPTSFFAGTDSVWPIVDNFRWQLQALSTDIRRRNEGLKYPYTYLDPAQVARSITA